MTSITLVDRVRAALVRVPRVAERRMFGGITFMVRGKMCISVGHGRLMCRIDPVLHDAALARLGVKTVRMKGRDYRGFVHVRESAVTSKQALQHWVSLCLAFNKRANRSPKRRRLTSA
jgi:TfoX/Sxy family transcriptional regulator of competence genes